MRLSRPLCLSVVALTLVAAGCAPEAEDDVPDESTDAEAWEPEYVDGVLQPLPDGFPDHEITILNIDDAGTNSGLYARDLQRALEDISPVDIMVSDEPRAAGGTTNALAEVMESREGGDEGYFPISASLFGGATDFLTEPITQETGLTIDDVNYFISTEQIPWVVAQSAEVPWGEGFEDFIEYGRANPGEIRYVSGGVGSGTDIAFTWMLDALDIEVTKIPAADRDAAMAAIGAGEGDVTLTQPALAAAAGDRITVTFATTQSVPEEFDHEGARSAADWADLGVDEPIVLGTYNCLMIGAAVPAQHVEWLYELFAAAAETDVYQTREDTVPGLEVVVIGPEEANQHARDAIEATEQLVKDAGLYWEDNQ